MKEEEKYIETVGVRLSADQREKVESAAAEAGVDVSVWIRNIIVPAAEDEWVGSAAHFDRKVRKAS